MCTFYYKNQDYNYFLQREWLLVLVVSTIYSMVHGDIDHLQPLDPRFNSEVRLLSM